MTNNKRVIRTFKFGCPCLTLKQGPKVKSDHIRRFPAHDFTLQTSGTNTKQVINPFKFDCPRLTLKNGPKVKSDHIKICTFIVFACVMTSEITDFTQFRAVCAPVKSSADLWFVYN